MAGLTCVARDWTDSGGRREGLTWEGDDLLLEITHGLLGGMPWACRGPPIPMARIDYE